MICAFLNKTHALYFFELLYSSMFVAVIVLVISHQCLLVNSKCLIDQIVEHSIVQVVYLTKAHTYEQSSHKMPTQLSFQYFSTLVL